MYDKKWEKFSLGKVSNKFWHEGHSILGLRRPKLSALRESTLAKEMHDAGAPGMQDLYMGG
jgi:arginine-tRNA-protein transferase